MTEGGFSIYYVVGPLVVFGPLFLWVLYNLGLREMFRIPEEMRLQREHEREQARRFRVEHARKRGERPEGGDRGPNRTPLGLFAQAVTYAWFAAVVGFFAAAPPYDHSQPGTARIKLSLSHPGKRKVECRRRTAKELARLPANMRTADACPRARWPVFVALALDGAPLMEETAQPKGLADDGPSIFYRVFDVPAGRHRIALRMRDHGDDGKGYETGRDLDLASGQVLVVGFDAAKGGFMFK